MNPKRNVTVTRGPWGYGDTSGSGIAGCVISAYRFRPGPDGRAHALCHHGTLNGVSVPIVDYDARRAECTRLGLLYGYIQYHGRNTGRAFVMSRAARKRGWVTFDPAYTRAVERHWEKS